MKMRSKALAAGIAAIVVAGGFSTAAQAGTSFTGTDSKTVAVGAEITIQNSVALQGGSRGCNITAATLTGNSGTDTVDFVIAGDAQSATAAAGSTTAPATLTADVVCVDGPKTYTTSWTINVLPAGTIEIGTVAAYYMLADANTGSLTATIGPEGNTATGTWSISDTGNTAGCSITGDNSDKVAFTQIGSCTVVASIGDNASYAAGSDSAVIVVKDTPTITVTGISNPYMAATGTVTIGGQSTGDNSVFTFAVTSAGDTNCTVVAATGVVTFDHEGTCSVTATAAATDGYVGATSAATDIVVHNTRTLYLLNNSFEVYRSGSAAVMAIPSVGTGDITYELEDAGTANCGINSSTGVMTWTGVGTCQVSATIAASGLYEAATSDVLTVTVEANTTHYTVTVTGYAPKGKKALSIRRATAVKNYLIGLGLTDSTLVDVTYVATGKTISGTGLKTLRTVVSVSWTSAGNTSTIDPTAVYFNTGASSLTGKTRWVKNARRTLGGIYAGTDL